jgi:hypothetical protein
MLLCCKDEMSVLFRENVSDKTRKGVGNTYVITSMTADEAEEWLLARVRAGMRL